MRKKNIMFLIIGIVLSLGGGYVILQRSQQYPILQAPVVIFDFDGTLANSLSTTVRVVNQLLAEDGYPATVQASEFQTKHLTAILKEHNIPLYKLPFFHKRALPLLKQVMTSITCVDGIANQLQKLCDIGYQLAIVTSNAEENVQSFLHHHRLEMFSVIYAQASIFGKQAVLKKFLKNSGLTTQDVIYIGDETRDITACHEAGIKVIGVSWGFNQRSLLEQAAPTGLIDHPDELLMAISNHLPHKTT